MEDSISSLTLGVSFDKSLEAIKLLNTWGDFVNKGLEFRAFKDESAWLLGALACQVEKKYGEDSITKLAKEIGMQTSTLEVYRWVVKQYTENNPDFIPSLKVSFTSYQAMAKLPPEKREAMVIEADDNNMSVERVRVEVKKLKGEKINPPKPGYRFTFCEEHQKWRWEPDHIDEWDKWHE